MAGRLTRLWWRLFGAALVAVLTAGSFVVGSELGRRQASAVTDPALALFLEECHSAASELAGLREEVSKLRQEGSVLERSRQIERETNKALQAQLKDAQDERLALIKEGTYLRRLIKEGGKGAVRVHDLSLLAGEEPGAFRYRFTVSQLIPDFGETKGQVSLRITGSEGGEVRELDLERLPHADPKGFAMGFDHFQSFEGELILPDGFEPHQLTVIINPEGDRLAATSEAFPWILDRP
ncbi:MAG: DUF6776 family protein [Bdellovibrio bacteriovorus]